MSDTKRTPLYDRHVALGAKLMPFAGYDMPIRYAGDTQEHLAVRERAGLFDVSHMGEFLVRGPQALPLLQAVTTNDLSKVPVGKAQYNTLPNDRGGLVDDLIVYRLEDELYLVVVNASNIAKDWAHISAANARFGAQMQDISDETALLALSGPHAPAILAALTQIDIAAIPYYGFQRGVVAGIHNVLVATTGYTGERTFELYVRSSEAAKLWDALLETGKPHGIEPIGLGARDTLRLEMGYMLYGNDITDDTSPLEAGLGWVTKLDKGDFTSRAIFQDQKAAGLQRKLVGFVVTQRGGIPRGHCELQSGGQRIGEVTSGTFSPSLKQGIGLGYVDAAYSKDGTEIEVIIRDKPVKAVVTKPPFVKGTSLAKWMAKD